ncbi:MAG TPA: antibiotic biosynthesis monooxygenase [Polyangiaceae bacterium]|nr:antibiotic biosynthesis monooxygenase [Polyangiaceae bacterium]
MLTVMVKVVVHPGDVAAFAEASAENAAHSLREPGIARFDVLQSAEEPTQFLLVEVYRDDEAPAKHKETAHYARWRDRVAPMMAVPRSSTKYRTVDPARVPAEGTR